jgi:predicted phosphodiesterase
VRLLLLSDIHSNLEALEACLAFAPNHDLVVNLGDIVGYGANPNEVIGRSRQLGKHFVRGNHDKAAAGLIDLKEFNPVAGFAALWTRQHVSAENLEWLGELPQGPIEIGDVQEAQFVHGSPLDEDDYLVTARDAIEPFLMTSIALTFFGHSHVQGAFSSNPTDGGAMRPAYRTANKAEVYKWPLKRGMQYLINPGSVGQPRDGDWRAAFAVFDTGEYSVSFYRTPYDVEQAQERILAADLPARLATRLAAGR